MIQAYIYVCIYELCMFAYCCLSWIFGGLSWAVGSSWSPVIFEIMSRVRSRSREKIISMAVSAELHRLPQDQRRSMQTLRQTVSAAGPLAQLGSLVRILRNTVDVALSLDFAESSTDALVLQGELKEIRNKIQELDQATTLVTQATMQKADNLIYDLVKNPDGSPYPMSETYHLLVLKLSFLRVSNIWFFIHRVVTRFVRAMEFSQRTFFLREIFFFSFRRSKTSGHPWTTATAVHLDAPHTYVWLGFLNVRDTQALPAHPQMRMTMRCFAWHRTYNVHIVELYVNLLFFRHLAVHSGLGSTFGTLR